MPLPLPLRLQWCFWAGYLVCCTAQRGAHSVSLAPFFFLSRCLLTSLPPLRLPCTYAQTARNRLPAPPYSSQCHRLFLFLLLLLRSHTIPPPPPRSVGRSLCRGGGSAEFIPQGRRLEKGRTDPPPPSAAAAKNRRMKRRRRPETASIAVVVFGQGGGIKKEGVYSAVARRAGGG